MIRKKVYLYALLSFLFLIAAWFVYHFRYKIARILIPFLVAVVISYVLHPLIIRLEKRKIKRQNAILMLYFIFAVILIAIIVFLVPEFLTSTRELANTLPEIISNFRNTTNNLFRIIQGSKWPEDIKNNFFSELHNISDSFQKHMVAYLKNFLLNFFKTVPMIFDFILSMIIAYYILKDADLFRESFLCLAPRKWRNAILSTCREINEILSNFIQGQLLTALIVGLLETIGLMILKVKYPLVLGLIGGIANIIPYFGPFIGAIPSVAIALTDSLSKAGWTILVFVAIQQIDNNFLTPKIIEGRLGLHPITTMLAVLAGGEFFGILGMLLAVPVVAIFKVIFKNIIEAIV